MEGRDVACIDLPGAYLHAVNEDEVIMKMEGKLAELMVNVEPKLYRKYVTTGPKGKPILYVKLYKALYGCLKSALLFYKKLVKDLTEYGFEINPYDPCVANKVINGHQMTVVWHVDDLKISHKNPWEITKFAKYLAKIYGENITVHRGKVHDYLGMTLDYSEPGKVKVLMVDYLKKILQDFPEELGAPAPTPAADHLFKVRPENERKLLSEDRAIVFHNFVARLMFTSARP